ncbi:MAG: DUF2974 domain-containing protein [Coriobacteriales bacterium]|jgi:hypothetical protein|nr:DUF2974 domain-containing protein [Coriobacteriales bacterium]
MTDDELSILDALIYREVFKDEEHVGSTLSEILDDLEADDLPCSMNTEEWQEVVDLAKDSPVLSRLVLKNANPDRNAGNHMAYFVDPITNEGYLIFAGTADNEWLYDVQGSVIPDPENKQHMLEWVKSLGITEDNPVTVSGHSDGGNDAMYITITAGKLVKRCLAVDAQGFSAAFLVKYNSEISANKHKIFARNQANDIVSALPLNSIVPKGHTETVGEWVDFQMPSIVSFLDPSQKQTSIVIIICALIFKAYSHMPNLTINAISEKRSTTKNKNTTPVAHSNSNKGTTGYVFGSCKRDFTQKRKEELVAMTTGLYSECSSILNYEGDLWSAEGLPNTKGYITELYNVKESSLKDIERVFSAVESIDNKFAARFSAQADALRNISATFSRLADEISV